MNLYETYEVARYLAIKDSPEKWFDDEDDDIFEDFIYNKYGCDIEQFQSLLNDLLPLYIIAESTLTNETYQGFGADGVWLMKKLV